MVRRCIKSLIAVAAMCALIACGQPPPPANQGLKIAELSGGAMGVTYTVKILYDPALEERQSEIDRVNNASLAVQRVFDALNMMMSADRADSEISRLNAIAVTNQEIGVSPETYAVLDVAQRVSEKTAGAFDVTIAPLMAAWGFGPDARTTTPTDAELAVLKERVGYELLTLSPTGSAVSKARADVQCDVSAIAKGFAVDKAAEALDALGCADYLIELGGAVRAKGRNERGEVWRVGIEKPTGKGDIELLLPLDGVALATVGDYRSAREEGGMRISHVIDPRSGRPVSNGVASVSVLHEECVLADAYAMALMVMGVEEGMRFAEEKELAALFIVRNDDGTFMQRRSRAFDAAQ